MTVEITDDDGSVYTWTVVDDGRVFDRIAALLGDPDTIRT